MKTSLLELRRETNKVVKALDKNQQVTLTRRGKAIGIITPAQQSSSSKQVKEHPAFGMWQSTGEESSVLDTVNKMRTNRYAL